MTNWPGGKPPRYYAGVIIRLRPDLRNKAVERVPKELRDWVIDLIQDHEARKGVKIL